MSTFFEGHNVAHISKLGLLRQGFILALIASFLAVTLAAQPAQAGRRSNGVAVIGAGIAAAIILNELSKGGGEKKQYSPTRSRSKSARRDDGDETPSRRENQNGTMRHRQSPQSPVLNPLTHRNHHPSQSLIQIRHKTKMPANRPRNHLKNR